MPSSDVAPLRIYCLCGQKMKVSEDMYGRPGKCVACRQKIRIPRPDELPPNTDIIHLKDHPEFLRKVKKNAAAEKAKEKEDIEVAPLPDLDPRAQVRKALGPLDTLEPLRIVMSLLAKVEQQIETSKSSRREKSDEPNAKFDELLGIRTRIRAAQQDLEEELRQRLMETAIELATVQEKIAELNLAVRVGEASYTEYRTQVDRLRRRRENQERRQANLRGWLTVDDAHRAGGFVDAPLDQIPKSFRITFSNEFDDNVTLLDAHVENLRAALIQRAAAERKLTEARKIRGAKEGTSSAGPDVVADAKADHERAQAHVQHARERLEQLVDDCSNDVQALEAQLDHTRGRLQIGQIKREEFAAAESTLLLAKTDLTKARALLVRALNANNAEEVPRARGTFVARLAHGRPGLRAPGDAWLAWAGAAILLLAILVPVANGNSPLQLVRLGAAQASSSHWFMTFPIGIALLTAIAALVPSRSWRGLCYCALWLLASLLTSSYLHEMRYHDNPVAETLRAGGPLFLRPGILVFCAGLLGIAAAAVAALVTTRDGRIVLPITAIATIAGLGAVATDWGGLQIPKPSIKVDMRDLPDTVPAQHEVTITLSNLGGRQFVLANNSTLANAYELSVEQRIGKNSGREVSGPVSARLGSTTLPTSSLGIPTLPISPGQAAELVYRLPDGDYRVELQGRESPVSEQSFSLESSATGVAATEPPPADAGQPATASTPVAATPSPTQKPPSLLMQALSAEVMLRGIVVAGSRPAQFSISVTLPDGASSEKTYAIGDEVFTRWNIKEFNPDEQTVTLGRGSKIIILRRGEAQRLLPSS